MRVFCFLMLLATITACKGQQSPTPQTLANLQSVVCTGDTVLAIEGEIRGICQDRQHNMWFASNGNGLYRFDGKHITNFTEKHGLCSNHHWAIQEDKDGNIWTLTYLRNEGGGLIHCRYDGCEFSQVSADTNAVALDFQKGEWLLGCYYDGQTLSRVNIPLTSPAVNGHDDPMTHDMFCSTVDKDGNLWVGTLSAGICRYDGTHWTWFTNPELLAPVRDIFQDSRGKIWVGNNGGGLSYFDDKQFGNLSRELRVDNPNFKLDLIGKPGMMSRVWKVAEDRDGHIWCATIDHGIWKYDGTRLTNFTTQDGLGTNAIWTIFFDADGKLWVGTGDNGVYFLEGEKFVRLGRKPIGFGK